jgi:twinkle protein
MKIISLNTKKIYDIDVNRQGENHLKCPECQESRKKKTSKPFMWNNTKYVGHCYHCDCNFVEYKPFKTEKAYVNPEWKNITELTDKVVGYFTSRMISQDTLVKMKVYSDVHFMPQLEKKVDVICFPYFFNGNLKNIKYRGPQKSFMLVKDAELIFWNLDCVYENKEIIIVEGEIDALTLIECGFNNVVSVPNGAHAKEMPFIDNYIELFEGKKIILAVDNDVPGVELKNELIRRFGSENCLTVEFLDCKDANEVLCEKGGIELKRIINEAKEIPVSGIIDIDSNYDEIYNLYLHGLEKGKTLGIQEIDELITWELARLAVWTGIPSHGKSSIVDLVNVILNIKYGWKVAYFSPESYPMKFHFARLYSLITGLQFKANGAQDETEYERVFNHISENFSFIYPEDNFKVETIMEKAKFLVKKKGINILTIDPWNNLEHTKGKGESDTDYTGRVLYELTKFGKKNNCLVHLVAHPTKMKKQANGLYEVPNMYDINGSANFYNRADYGFSIYRYFGEDAKVEFNVLKVKWKHLGEGGTAQFRYNTNGRLENLDRPKDQWNISNFLDNGASNSINSNNVLQANLDFDFYRTEKDDGETIPF